MAVNHTFPGAVIQTGLEKNIRVTRWDKRVTMDKERWCVTINQCSGKIGIFNSGGRFDIRDFAEILEKNGLGANFNFDLGISQLTSSYLPSTRSQ